LILTTETIPVDAEFPDEEVIVRAAGILRRGGLVAFPTETVYGLGADAMNVEAVKKVFAAKGRPADNPLIVHVSAIDQFFELGKEISPVARQLAETFWPGPLTLVVKRKSFVPDIVTAGLETVAVRIPRHAVAVALAGKVQHGIVGPSANLSGKPSPTAARHVYEDLKGRIDMILDAGPTTIGVESTVVDTTTTPPAILRLGGLTRELIESVAGKVRTTGDKNALKRSPGTRYRHYAPKAKVELIEMGNPSLFTDTIRRYRRKGITVGCIVHSPQLAAKINDEYVLVVPATVEAYAKQLFDAMRKLDAMGVGVILAEEVPEIGLGVTVMDRLRRAAQPENKNNH
jgi:L-threonylcarbamoyladenylate synthase